MGITWQLGTSTEGMESTGFAREFARWSSTQANVKQNRDNTDPADMYPTECVNFNPVNQGQEEALDYFYNQIAAEGIGMVPAMMNTIPYYSDNLSDTPRYPGDTTNYVFDVTFQGTWLPIYWDAIWDGEGSDPNNYEPQGTAAESREAATSYIPRADWMRQFVARYGAGSVDPASIKYCAGNDDGQANLGTINYIESWNEPDRYWDGPEAQFSPEEYAVMTNLDFDGDDGIADGQNTKLFADDGNGDQYQLGVHSVDSTINFVMGGTYNIHYDGDGTPYTGDPANRMTVWDYWVGPMIDWYKAHRDEYVNDPRTRLPFDVLNFHHYSVDDASDLTTGRWLSPEEDMVRTRIEEEIYAEMVTAGWKENPIEEENKELWISEFGYDTNQEDENNGWDFKAPGGPVIVDGPVFGELYPEDLQAQWIVRSFLELYAAGVDRAMVHDIRNTSDMPIAAWDKHTGLMTFEGEPKKSWFYVFGMKNILTGYRFEGDEQSQNCSYGLADTQCTSNITRIYQFKNEAGKSIWAVWSPSHCDIDPYPVTFNLSPENEGATGFRLGRPGINGILENLTVNGSQVTVMASETPIFIVEEDRTPPTCPTNLVGENITCTSAEINFDIPTDQQYDTYKVWYGEASEINNPDNPDFSAYNGNVTQFQYDANGNQSSVHLTGLSAGTAYYIYVIPENENGIPIDANGSPEYCHTILTTSSVENICRIDMSPNAGIVNIVEDSSNSGELFDEQDLDFCGSVSPTPNLAPDQVWLKWGSSAVLTIEFLQENYIIDQITYYDAEDGGQFTIEWSIDNINWNDWIDFYTSDKDVWKTIGNLEMPGTGVRYLRITAHTDKARLRELFICGRPVCSIAFEGAAPGCTDTDLNFSSAGNGCAFTGQLAILNSGIEDEREPDNADNHTDRVGITQATMNYPNNFHGTFDLQLIPGVEYTASLTSCDTGPCTTSDLVFQTGTACSNVLGQADYPPMAASDGLLAYYYSGCTATRFILPDDIPADGSVKVEIWTAENGAFTTDRHPMSTDNHPDARHFTLDVEYKYRMGKFVRMDLGSECIDATRHIAYRYVTEHGSSPLYSARFQPYFAQDPLYDNMAFVGLCRQCETPNTGSPFYGLFRIEDCKITGIYYEKLKAGSQLEHRELKQLNSSNQSAFPQTQYVITPNNQVEFHTEIHTVTTSEHLYVFQHPDDMDLLKFRILDGSDYNTLDLSGNTDCPGAKEKEDGRSPYPSSISELELSPNPTKTYLDVKCNDCGQMVIFGIDGKTHHTPLLQSTSWGYRVSTTHLTSGIYFVRTVSPTGGVQSAKFVVR